MDIFEQMYQKLKVKNDSFVINVVVDYNED